MGSVAIALCGDGCLQEGISHEGACFAAHEGLDNLIIVYDSNDVTLDKMAEYTQSEDTAARYEAYGWEVITIDGHDLAAIKKSMDHFRTAKNGKPKLGLKEPWEVSSATRDFFKGVTSAKTETYNKW